MRRAAAEGYRPGQRSGSGWFGGCDFRREEPWSGRRRAPAEFRGAPAEHSAIGEPVGEPSRGRAGRAAEPGRVAEVWRSGGQAVSGRDGGFRAASGPAATAGQSGLEPVRQPAGAANATAAAQRAELQRAGRSPV